MARNIAFFLMIFTLLCRLIYLYAPTHGEDNANANNMVIKATDVMIIMSSLWLLYTYYTEWSSL
jgi:hypothetical protein